MKPPQSPWHGPPIFDEVSLRAGLPALVPLPDIPSPSPRIGRPWGIATITTSAVLLVGLATGALLAAHPSTGIRGSGIAKPSVAVSPTATSTPRIHAISGAYIGGTESAFSAQYGSPTVAYQIPVYDATIGTVEVTIKLSDLEAGSDGQQRVVILALADPSGTTWDVSTSTSVVSQFLPPDARHIRDDQTPDVGTLHVYQSADLAATFPAAAFTTSNGVKPPGTFAYACDAPGNIGCTILLGE